MIHIIVPNREILDIIQFARDFIILLVEMCDKNFIEMLDHYGLFIFKP